MFHVRAHHSNIQHECEIGHIGVGSPLFNFLWEAQGHQPHLPHGKPVPGCTPAWRSRVDSSLIK